MNRLDRSSRLLILNMLVEGSSMRSISRTAGVSFSTVNKLLVDAGTVCAEFHDSTVRNVKSRKIQMDELWHFLYAKEKNVSSAKIRHRKRAICGHGLHLTLNLS